MPLLHHFQGSLPELIGCWSWPWKWLVMSEAQAQFQKLSEMSCKVCTKHFASLEQLICQIHHMQTGLQRTLS